VAHPLLDRRDLTAQREQPAPAPDYGHAEGLQALCAELARTNRLLCSMVEQQRAEVVQLCVTDGEVAEAEMLNFPAPAAHRLIVRRPGAGGTFALAANVPTPILLPNDTRLGGQIVNTGAAAVTLFLARDLLVPGSATPLSAGAAQIALNANGGLWNLLLSNLLWSGGVVAVAAVGGSSVSVAEV
jgi:hypothetical protein